MLKKMIEGIVKNVVEKAVAEALEKALAEALAEALGGEQGDEQKNAPTPTVTEDPVEALESYVAKTISENIAHKEEEKEEVAEVEVFKFNKRHEKMIEKVMNGGICTTKDKAFAEYLDKNIHLYSIFVDDLEDGRYELSLDPKEVAVARKNDTKATEETPKPAPNDKGEGDKGDDGDKKPSAREEALTKKYGSIEKRIEFALLRDIVEAKVSKLAKTHKKYMKRDKWRKVVNDITNKLGGVYNEETVEKMWKKAVGLK